LSRKNIPFDDKLKNYISAVSVDYGFAQISSIWTQIATMQQNASILLTLLIFTITIMFNYITSSNMKNIKAYENMYLLIFVCCAIFYAIIAFIFLIKILKPKKIELLVDASNYRNLLMKKIDGYIHDSMSNDQKQDMINTITIKVMSQLNKNLQKVIDKNQENYSYCLNSCIISFFSCINVLIFILLKLMGVNFSINLIFILFIFSLLIILLLSIILILNKIKE